MARSTHPNYSAADRYERRATRRQRRLNISRNVAIALSLEIA